MEIMEFSHLIIEMKNLMEIFFVYQNDFIF